TRRVLEAELLDRVEHTRDHRCAVAVDELGDEVAHLLLREGPVDELVPDLERLLVDRALEGPLDLRVEDHSARSRQDELAVAPVLDRLLELDLPGFQRELDLLLGGEALRTR